MFASIVAAATEIVTNGTVSAAETAPILEVAVETVSQTVVVLPPETVTFPCTDDVSLWKEVLSAAGGLGIFLLGMKQISEGLQAVAGSRMRKLVAAATTNRVVGVLTGGIVTAIIQASAVTTVMVVGLVTSGIMTLVQAVNVIIGANIGTTATAWLVSLFPKVGPEAGLAIIAFASMIYLFAKRESWKYTGLVFLGLGLIFFGLGLMNEHLGPLSETKGFIAFLQSFEANSTWGLIKCIFVGAAATALIQSSSATTAISIALAINGMITFDTAASLVLGMNIGTTITAWLAAIGAPTDARRAALAHTLFNLIGVAIMAPFFLPVVLPAVKSICHIQELGLGEANGDIAIPIAAIHTAFNIANTLIFLPFVTWFVKLICWIIPDSKVRETPRLAILDPRKMAPVVAVEQARKEVEFMSLRCESILSDFRRLLSGERSEELEQLIFRTEEELDTIQHEVSSFLGTVMSTQLPSDVAFRARMLLRVADEFESVSDEIAGLLKQIIRIRKNNMMLSDRGRADLLVLHDRCFAFAHLVSEGFRQGKTHAHDILSPMHHDAAEITVLVKEIRENQMMRIAEHDPSIDPLCAVVVLDMLNLYRRLKEDYLNIGEAMIDETDAR